MSHFKKSVAIFLIIATLTPQLFFLTLPPPRAHASAFGPVPVYEIFFDPDFIKNWLLDFFARLLAEVFIRKLGDAVVSWIQGGETNFVQDIEAALKRVADEEAGRFLNQLTGVNMCGNLNQFLQVTLRIGISSEARRRARYRCTLTSIVVNVENFYDDFQQGGWEAFVRLNVQMQNTAHGAYFIALDEKNNLTRRKVGRQKEDFKVGAGFLGVRQTRNVCTDLPPGAAEEDAAAGGTGQTCKDVTRTTTPGRAVADSLSKTLGTDFDFTVVADEINEIITRIISALIHRVMSSELLDFDSGGPSHSRGTPQFTPLDRNNPAIEQVAPSTTCGATAGGTLATTKDTAQVGEQVTWRVQFGAAPPASWTWNDSDGNSASSTETFITTYQTPGTKTATVTNCYNNTDSKTGAVTGQTCNAPVSCRQLSVGAAATSTSPPPGTPPPPPGTPPPPPGTPPPPPPPFAYTLSVAPAAISVLPGRRGTTTATRTTTAGTPQSSTLTVGTLPSDLLSNILTNRICTPSPTCNSEIEFSVRLGAATGTAYSIVIDVEPPDPQPSNGPQVITVTVP
ncbi:MAG: hypothetical protein AAB539_02745 [Patescibacteria group bacterium]